MNVKKSLISRVFALVMALVLAGGLVPSSAFASTLKKATLQIAYDTNGDNVNELVVNSTFYYTEDDLDVDALFMAAARNGYIGEYGISDYGYLENVDGHRNSSGDTKLSWMSYINGAMDDSGADTKLGALLKDGSTYSYSLESFDSNWTLVEPVYDFSQAGLPTVEKNICGSATLGATLQLAYDTDGDNKNEIVLNKIYGFEDGTTLGDLFATAKAAGDIKDYVFDDTGYGAYLVSVTLADGTEINNGPVYSSYWASFTDGDYNNAPKQTDALKDGAKYQFGYEKLDKSVTEVDWEEADSPEVSTAVAKKAGDVTPVDPVDPVDPDDDSDKATVNKYDAERAALLLENLAARFKKDGADASITNDTFQAAVALNQLGMGAQLDADAIIANLEKSMAKGSFTSGTYAKYILALTAAGVDCTKVTFSDGTVHNAVDEMNAMVDKETAYIYGAVCVLPVYQSYADNSGREAKLIDTILAAQSDEGLFGESGWEDTQTTAQAITALLPYYNSRSDVKDAIEKAVKALYSMQNEDGGFAYLKKGTASNLDATSAIVVALTSLGYDCAEGEDLTTSNGSTPLGWLVAQADQDSFDNFDRTALSDEAMTAATAALALTADAQFNACGFFSAYSLKPVDRNGEQPKKADDATTTSTTTTTKKNVPSTGDESVAGVAVLAVAVVGGVVIVESKRRRNAA